jgi:hypothetical protein
MKVPTAISCTLHRTIAIQRTDFPSFRSPPLSYSYIAAIDWMHISGPSRAPMRETRASKTGIALATSHAIRVTPEVQATQVSQWVKVLLVRWREPRRRWTKMNLAGI